ncbi:serine protease [Streptomyces antibioticus]|uniref:trypsin-like peptidase domain-containing protein n=1 Tax=Streptomyces antibioticus TaxID=1890 RepID=UPI00224EED5F|nr:trypsin-like peptidase domain-containing protein [Streptomyces antibioticus]MCX5171870.1 serine protease [Streptomyces antibioticus]
MAAGGHEASSGLAHPAEASLVRIRDLAGRPRGTGFVADHHGTVITSHEAVDGLPRLVLHTADDRDRAVTADAVTAFPELDLALVRTEGLDARPLPLTVRDTVEAGRYVRLPAGCWREARVLGETPVTYTATDRPRLLDGALELAIGTAGRDALRLGGGAAGGPVLDATTGAVVAVVGTALQCGGRDAGFAVPLRPAPGPLADLLARNAATVPAYGADLNLAGILELAATSVGSDGPPDPGSPTVPPPVERPAPAREFAAFEASPATVLGLVGAPGSGRTTELAALAARRGRGGAPAPTLWLRGADLRAEDDSIADAAHRALHRAARIVGASAGLSDTAFEDLCPGRLARLAHTAGRPLLLLLDGPEEMPPALVHRLAEWTRGTDRWLREAGARLVVACRPEYWERAGAHFPAEALHGAAGSAGELPACVRLGDLTPEEACEARARYGVPETALTTPDARHPLTLRLLGEIRAALPADAPAGPVDRHDVLGAHLDLMCLRIAVRLAAGNGLRGTAVRRLAAKVAGQVHEAARRSLGPGQGELDRASFEAVFPWGQAPARLGGGTGWASAVLAEGLLVPAGGGYRFAHEELADWIQGLHLDLDEALRALVHRHGEAGGEGEEGGEPGGRPLPVPHHRIGPVVQALLLLGRHQGAPRLTRRLEELADALDADPASWWAARLLAETLLRVPDATPYATVLGRIADGIAASGGGGVVAGEGRGGAGLPLPEFGPGFWTAIRVPLDLRLDLLRRLVLADPAAPPDADALRGPRYLDTVARLLAARPTDVQLCLTRWFDDERPLPAAPHATVATAAQALLHTHRHRALDDLTEALAARAHRRADELLAVLAEEEPSALCRAVERWAHDDRPARRAAAVAHGLRAAPHVTTDTDRRLLRHAALALLARPADRTLHTGALGLLVRDLETRAGYLPQALRRFADGDPGLPAHALLAALATDPDPEPVLTAVRTRLRRPDAGAGRVLRALVEAATPALAGRVAALVAEGVERHPEAAGDVAAHVDRRLDAGPAADAVLFPLVTSLLDERAPEPLRAALAAVLASPGAPASRPPRRELLDFLLGGERAPAVLDAVLHAAAQWHGEELRALVHRTGLLLVRTPEGAARFDRGLVDLGRHVPGFAARVTGWLTGQPADWAAVVGPSARRMLENLAGARVPV